MIHSGNICVKWLFTVSKLYLRWSGWEKRIGEEFKRAPISDSESACII